MHKVHTKEHCIRMNTFVLNVHTKNAATFHVLFIFGFVCWFPYSASKPKINHKAINCIRMFVLVFIFCGHWAR